MVIGLSSIKLKIPKMSNIKEADLYKKTKVC